MRVGGGSLWMTPAYDPAGPHLSRHGQPGAAEFRSDPAGRQLYTMCLVALDVHTGKLRWYYQQVPHDEWGYDVAAPPFLLDGPNGTKAVASASKTGWIYVHDGRAGSSSRGPSR